MEGLSVELLEVGDRWTNRLGSRKIYVTRLFSHGVEVFMTVKGYRWGVGFDEGLRRIDLRGYSECI